jgi:UDP-N-acetylglucosamine--N-acetylmuramyl-(pentapeptide) pyrophosphoryl-undecaprenol N-acetylglucosamine transferase
MDDHQKDNAISLSEQGAAWVVLEEDLTSSKIQEIIKVALDDDEKLKSMATRMHTLGQPEASQKLARMVEEIIKS